MASLEPIAEPLELNILQKELITKSHWKLKDNYGDLAEYLYRFWKRRIIIILVFYGKL